MPTSMRIQDIMNPSGEQIETGFGRVMETANAMQNLQQKQLAQQQMRQQLDNAKFNTYLSIYGNALQMSDPVFKAAQKQIDNRLRQIVPEYQPGSLAALRSDPELRAGIASFRNAVATGEIPVTPEIQQQVLSSAGDLGMTEQLIKTFSEQRQLQMSANLRQAAIAAQLRGQDIGLEKAAMTLEPVLDEKQRQAVKDITEDKIVVGNKNLLQQANKDFDIIQQAKVDGITPLKAEELVQSYVSLLKSASDRSIGAEREALAAKSKDIETRIGDLRQKFQTQGFVKYQNNPLLRDIEKDLRGLHGTIQNNMLQRINEKTRKSNIRGINEVQQKAIDELVKGSELGYKPQVKQMGEQQPGVASTPAPAPAPTPAVSKASQVIELLNRGVPDDQIMQQLGVSANSIKMARDVLAKRKGQ